MFQTWLAMLWKPLLRLPDPDPAPPPPPLLLPPPPPPLLLLLPPPPPDPSSLARDCFRRRGWTGSPSSPAPCSSCSSLWLSSSSESSFTTRCSLVWRLRVAGSVSSRLGAIRERWESEALGGGSNKCSFSPKRRCFQVWSTYRVAAVVRKPKP